MNPPMLFIAGDRDGSESDLDAFEKALCNFCKRNLLWIQIDSPIARLKCLSLGSVRVFARCVCTQSSTPSLALSTAVYVNEDGPSTGFPFINTHG
jgi:hypothetical protein